MPKDKLRILLVDDDELILSAVGSALRAENFVVRTERDGRALEEAISLFRPDLAVLDVNLGVGPDGPVLARRLRTTSNMPLMFLTAAGSEEARLAGFDAGADDYLTKPFSMAELLARIRALLRRSGRLASAVCEVGDVMIDGATRTVRRSGHQLDLTRTEFELLSALAHHPGQVLSKTQLLTTVWGFDAGDSNLVEVHTSALRRKLEEHGPRLLHTVRGTGYVLRPQP
ncbi:MAG TPA: response regulator transcription factor [Acidimicrobiales bacterium]|nr:response regulator transcription factor [Acidimicrobiales bacterium]